MDRIHSALPRMLFLRSGNSDFLTFERWQFFFIFFLFYRVYHLDLIQSKDLWGQLKTTFRLWWRYLYIPEYRAFEFHPPVFKKVTYAGLNSLRQKGYQLRLQRLLRSMRLQRFLRPKKSLLRTSESSRFMNSII